MIDNKLYEMIFKRKSFHTFRERNNIDKISETELADILDAYKNFDPLFPEIKTAIEIRPINKTNCKRNAEYCVLMFSEEKDNYLQNIGYLGEQLDLYLVSKNIASLWFGIAKCNDTLDGLKYVIMIAIAKINDETKYRKDMFAAKRKELKDIWSGELLDFANIVRFAPSACNSQPWYVENDNNKLSVYRKSKSGKIGIMPKNASVFYNQIDIGIFLCFMELCLQHNGYQYKRTLYKDKGSFDNKELNAEYQIM